MDGIDTNKRIELYKRKSQEMRLKCLHMVKKAKKGHLGGTFSIIDILSVLYYGQYLQLYRKSKEYGDCVVIGKGHANLAFLNIWQDLGYISEEMLNTYGQNGGIGGQLDTKMFTVYKQPMHSPNIVDNITGSLGHAIGIASGIAISNRLDGNNNKSLAIVGDGEMEEGSIWEALDFAAKQNLNNLLCVVDRNRLGVTHFLENDNLEEKVKSFGWEVYTTNGHIHKDIEYAFDKFFLKNKSKKPTMIIANTIKGKGVSFMENDAKWHHGCPTDDEYQRAILDLEI